MDINSFVERVNSTNWQKYDDAKYFQYRYDGINSFAQTVPQALIALALVDKESDELLDMNLLKRIGKSRTDFISNAPICSNLMFAIGNDHAGYYYPVALEALFFIIEVALYGNHVVARNCAIDSLINLYYFASDDDSGELTTTVKKTIKNMIIRHKDNFIKFTVDDKRCNAIVDDLVGIIDDGSGSMSEKR